MGVRKTRVHTMGWHPTTTVTVPDFQELMYQWRKWKKGMEQFLIGRVIVEKTLTQAQMARLHSDLRRKIHTPDDSVPFLESLWALKDPR